MPCLPAVQKPTCIGYIAEPLDALLSILAVVTGIWNPVTGRLGYLDQQTLIQSGMIFVSRFAEITRWTDNKLWTASYSVDYKYLMYHERLDTPRLRRIRRTGRRTEAPTFSSTGEAHLHTSLYGSWDSSDPTIKKGGLLKKTFSWTVDGVRYRVVSYHTPADVHAGLPRLSELPALQHLLEHPAVAAYDAARVKANGRGRGRTVSSCVQRPVAPAAHTLVATLAAPVSPPEGPPAAQRLRLEALPTAPRPQHRPLPPPIVLPPPTRACAALPPPRPSPSCTQWSPLGSEFSCVSREPPPAPSPSSTQWSPLGSEFSYTQGKPTPATSPSSAQWSPLGSDFSCAPSKCAYAPDVPAWLAAPAPPTWAAPAFQCYAVDAGPHGGGMDIFPFFGVHSQSYLPPLEPASFPHWSIY